MGVGRDGEGEKGGERERDRGRATEAGGTQYPPGRAGTCWCRPFACVVWLYQSADGLTGADADNPESGQCCLGHLNADPLAGAQVAQATGIQDAAFKGNLTAIVKQHTA